MSDKTLHLPWFLRDLVIGMTLLTILPMPRLKDTDWENPSTASWSFPLIGAGLGAVTGSLALLALAVGLPFFAAALIGLATLTIITGAMHEDGLADCVDALGARSPARRLEIMKDSQIGTYGALALILAVALKWSLLASIDPDYLLAAFVTVGAVSRAPISAIAALLPNARDTGLSTGFGRPDSRTACAASALAFIISIIWVGWATVPAAILTMVAMTILMLMAKKLIGGQTGDVFGASQQIAEISVLLALAPILS